MNRCRSCMRCHRSEPCLRAEPRWTMKHNSLYLLEVNLDGARPSPLFTGVRGLPMYLRNEDFATMPLKELSVWTIISVGNDSHGLTLKLTEPFVVALTRHDIRHSDCEILTS